MWSLTFDFKARYYSLLTGKTLVTELEFLLTKGEELSFTNLSETPKCPALSTAPVLPNCF